MERKRLEFPDGIVEVIDATRTRGTIVCAGDQSGSNGMTIGWITIGSSWSRPICAVLVRPSRYTHKFMESGDSFTVNVLPEDLQGAVDLFGTESGRDMDKFAEAPLTATKGLMVASPYIAEASLVVECRIAFKQPMDRSLITADWVEDFYGGEDYHTIYYGEILAIHAK